MSLQYLQDDSGQTIAVLIPIEEWKAITQKHADVAVLEKPGTKKIKKLRITRAFFLRN